MGPISAIGISITSFSYSNGYINGLFFQNVLNFFEKWANFAFLEPNLRENFKFSRKTRLPFGLFKICFSLKNEYILIRLYCFKLIGVALPPQYAPLFFKFWGGNCHPCSAALDKWDNLLLICARSAAKKMKHFTQLLCFIYVKNT
jgi:hypothetical protein